MLPENREYCCNIHLPDWIPINIDLVWHSWTLRILLQKGGPLSGPKGGLLSNTRKWIVWGDTCADKARDFIGRDFIGKVHPVESRRASELGGLFCHVAHNLGFYGDEISFYIVSGQSFWQGSSWWPMHHPAKTDFTEKAPGRIGHMGWCLLLTFDFTGILPVDEFLLVPCSLSSGSPIIK